jgi:hypothetical protein
MTEEGFLGRWSRRKRAALRPPAPVDPVPPPPAAPSPELPPIDSLGSASDYTAFLQRGVAADVQQAALGRAWASDERIAEFRGMGEYDWDFNAPDYGKLAAADDVGKLIQAVLALAPEVEEEPPATDLAAPSPEPVPSAEIEPEPPAAAPRRHGTARPS